MLAAVGHPVRRLHRSRYGPLTVDGLALRPSGGRSPAPRSTGFGAGCAESTRPLEAHEAHALVHRLERGRGGRAGLVGPGAEQADELGWIVAERVVALLDRLEQLDDRLGDVALELPVAAAVVARLDRLGASRRWRRS